jgi:hypothetical protein
MNEEVDINAIGILAQILKNDAPCSTAVDGLQPLFLISSKYVMHC